MDVQEEPENWTGITKALQLSQNMVFNNYKEHIGHTIRVISRVPNEIILFCETCEREKRTQMQGDYEVDIITYHEVG